MEVQTRQFLGEQRDFWFQEEKRLKSKALLWSSLRLACFVAMILLLALGGNRIDYIWWIEAAGLALLLLFVKIHDHFKSKRDYASARRDLLDREISTQDGSAFYFDFEELQTPHSHDYATDLDLLSEGGIFQWLDRSSTKAAKLQLQNDLLQPNLDHELILQKQESVKELSQKQEWSWNFRTRAALLGSGWDELQDLFSWLEGNSPLQAIAGPRRNLYQLLRYLAPIASVAGIILGIAGFGWNFLTAVMVINLGISGSLIKSSNSEHAKLSRKMSVFAQYGELFQLCESEQFNSKWVQSKQSEISDQAGGASRSLARLSSIVSYFDMRLNLLLALLINALLLWDIQCLFALEKWKKEASTPSREWFQALAEIEAALSISNLHFNEPQWVFPVPGSDQKIYDAKDLGHPLIPASKRILNDLHLENPGDFLLITGANMAGKSTFLRTAGVNLLLAYLGAPVCASAMNCRPQAIYSSMRNTDSLQEDASYFFAELRRLQILIQRLESGQKHFVLIDEMLKGTNSKDQHAGSVALIQQLLKLKSNGLVATHDIELGELASEFSQIFNFCFEAMVESGEMIFDYKLRSGVCQHFNATFLMQQMGIMKDAAAELTQSQS
jgi:hypothetical protein